MRSDSLSLSLGLTQIHWLTIKQFTPRHSVATARSMPATAISHAVLFDQVVEKSQIDTIIVGLTTTTNRKPMRQLHFISLHSPDCAFIFF